MQNKNAAAYLVLFCCAVTGFLIVARPQETEIYFSALVYFNPELG